ncbi:MAG: malate dehydrogenase, partial [Marinilabiliales bacterium]
ALLVRARKITDEMAIKAAYSMANYAEKRGLNPDDIMPKMDETEMFAYEAADVAMEAIKNGVARVNLTWEEAFNRTMEDIKHTRATIDMMMQNNFIQKPDEKLLEQALETAINSVS